jgi:SH3-like domain-containing protein
MPRRSKTDSPEKLRQALVDLLTDFEQKLKARDLRKKVVALIPAYHTLRDLGSSLIPSESASSARDRILHYFRKYPLCLIEGEELAVVAGISEWARRVRELRVEHGWMVVSGVTAREMAAEDEFIDVETKDGFKISALKPDHYVLMSTEQDRDAAYRWNVANDIRKSKLGSQESILEFLRMNVGKPISGEELRYVARDASEWARRVRELRTEDGWPVQSKTSGRPDLPVGVYVLEEDRQSPEHDRTIPDPVRRKVLQRDNYTCTACSWNHDMWNPSDPRHLELHHKEHHARGGDNTEENLITLCTVCHDDIHRKEGQGKRQKK